jgi:iron(III) transport system permease protein
MKPNTAGRIKGIFDAWPLGLTLGLILAAVLVPICGLILAMLDPADLFTTPPREWADLIYLILRTLGLATIVSFTSLVFGTWLAWTQTRTNYFGRRWLALASTLPLAVPSYLLATIVREAMAPRGSLGSIVGSDTVFSGFLPACLVLTLSCTPYVQLLVSSALGRIPASTDEAAQLLGAGPWKRFWTLTANTLRPTWTFSLVIVAFYVISDFGAVAVLNCEVLTWALYQARHSPADAVRIGFGMLLCVIPILIGLRLLHGAAKPERHLGDARLLERTELKGPLLLVTYGLHGVTAGLGLFLPIITLLSWVLHGIEADITFTSIWAPLSATLIYTLLGALVTMLCALLPAWTFGRYQGKLGEMGEHATYAASSLPGILVAMGIFYVFLGVQRNLSSSQSAFDLWTTIESFGLFLLFGYMVRFLSEGYAAIKPAVLRLDLRHEESAQTLGASRGRIFREITLPALTPGMFTAYCLLFIAIAKELPITLMLTPLGRQTLAYRIFDAQQEGALADVGLGGILLLSLAFTIQALLYRWRRHV